MLSGTAVEHILGILWGKGRNGKGTLLEILAFVLGPLAGPILAEMLLEQTRKESASAPRSDIMGLRGRRLAWASETDEERRLNAGKVKWLCGGDTLVGRAPYGRREISFRPTHTLFLLTNHKPQVDPTDNALWSRIHLIAFTLAFVDKPKEAHERLRDPYLLEKLKGEASGILAWLVRGCLEWQRQGLNPPAEVRGATEEYRDHEDVLAAFIADCCTVSPNARVKAGKLRESFESWCKEMGMTPIDGKKFGQRIRERFDATPRTKHGFYYIGIGLCESEQG